MKELNVKITLTNEMLGMTCSDAKIHEMYIASHAHDALSIAEEVEAIIKINVNGEIGSCQRSLRISGPTGDRVALANSDTVPEKSTIEFKIMLLNDDMETWVRECLDYGKLRGLGQWRNSGKGTFEWEEIN